MRNIPGSRVGNFWWIKSPRTLPILVYVLEEFPNSGTVVSLPVHEDTDLASADDLIFSSTETSCDRDLVIMCRLPFEIPDHYIADQSFASLSPHSQVEVREMSNGERRPAYRTGVLIRSRDDLRWELVTEYTSLINALLDEAEELSDSTFAETHGLREAFINVMAAQMTRRVSHSVDDQAEVLSRFEELAMSFTSGQIVE